MIELSQSVKDLLLAPNFGHLATVQPDGGPQNTPIWVDTDGQFVLLNTANGRRKIANIRRDPRIALSVVDSTQPYRWVQIRGRVVDVISEGADAHIDKLALKYLGKETYPFRQAGEERLILKIEPDRVSGMGMD